MYYTSLCPEDKIRVHYRVTQGREYPAEELYCCTECSSLLSSLDVTDDIESYICFQCLESLSATEAASYKYCCSRCFQCPSCAHVLTYTKLMVKPEFDNIETDATVVSERETSQLPIMKPPRLSQSPQPRRSLQKTLGRPGLPQSKTSSPKVRSPVKPDSTPKPIPVKQLDSTGVSKTVPEHSSETHNVNVQDITYQLLCQYCHWDSSHLQIHADSLNAFITALTSKINENICTPDFNTLINCLRRRAGGHNMWFKHPVINNSTVLNKTALLTQTQAILSLEKKNALSSNNSIWDAYECGFGSSVNGDSSTLGIKISVSRLLNINDPAIQTQLSQMKERLSLASFESVPTQEQLIRSRQGLSIHHIDDLLPIPKPLLTKRSRRCRTCKRYVTRGQTNPTASLRLNNSAITFLPDILLLRLITEDTIPFTTILNNDISLRFPRLSSNTTAYLDLELSNTLETASIFLDFGFGTSHATDTIDCLSKNFSTSLASYDDFLEEDITTTEKPVNITDTEALREKTNHRLRLRIKLRAKNNLPPGSLARCSFQLTMKAATLNLVLNPVIVLGRFI